jgi:hypothetical protein
MEVRKQTPAISAENVGIDVRRATGDYPPGERHSMWRVTIMERDWREERLSA